MIVTFGEDFSEINVDEIKQTLLQEVYESHCANVIFEMSALKFLDTIEFEQLKDIMKMISTLGVKSMLVGLRPGIIHHLVLHDVDISGISTSLDLNDALNKLEIVTNAPRK